MRKDTTTAKLTGVEIERNKKISKKRYIVEQYFGLSHLHDGFRLVELPARRVPTGPGLAQLLKTSGTQCAGRLRSIYFEGVSYWLRGNSKGEVRPESKMGMPKLLKGPIISKTKHKEPKNSC